MDHDLRDKEQTIKELSDSCNEYKAQLEVQIKERQGEEAENSKVIEEQKQQLEQLTS